MPKQNWSGGGTPYYLRKFKLGNDPSTAAAYGNLFDILAGKGAVDPALYNRNMASQARDIQAARDEAAGSAAAHGLSGAATTTATDAALVAKGAQALSDTRAKYAADQAERVRGDLSLYQTMIMQPSQFLKEIRLRRYLAQLQLRAAKAGGGGKDWGGILGGLGSIVSGAAGFKGSK